MLPTPAGHGAPVGSGAAPGMKDAGAVTCDVPKAQVSKHDNARLAGGPERALTTRTKSAGGLGSLADFAVFMVRRQTGETLKRISTEAE